MKQVFFALLLCVGCLGCFSLPAQAAYFDGMEAYRQSDYQTALREFKAVEDDAKAQYMIGVIYEKGQGVTIDHTEAAGWYRKAADKGNPAAQYRLGRYYERGLGVEESREEAIKWYKKSAKQGYVDARQALKRMEAK
jgi:TPR repeat protein